MTIQLDGRWRNAQIQEFWDRMVQWRAQKFAERMKEINAQYEQLHPEIKKQYSKADIIHREFAYIDQLLEMVYLGHFTSVTKTAVLPDTTGISINEA